MQLESKDSILDNVQKVIVRTQALAIRMDMVEAEYKAKIAELEKRDPSEKLKADTEEISGKIEKQIQETAHLLETTTSSWMGIEQIETIEEVHVEIHQDEANITRLKEEMEGLTPVQQMIKSGKSKKLQIRLQKLRKEETEFLKVTQPWQDELAELTLQVETNLAEFREIQTTATSFLIDKVTKESLEQVKGSVTELDSVQNKLQDVYIQWYDKTNKIIEERKEQKQRTIVSGSGMSHK